MYFQHFFHTYFQKIQITLLEQHYQMDRNYYTIRYQFYQFGHNNCTRYFINIYIYIYIWQPRVHAAQAIAIHHGQAAKVMACMLSRPWQPCVGRQPRSWHACCLGHGMPHGWAAEAMTCQRDPSKAMAKPREHIERENNAIILVT